MNKVNVYGSFTQALLFTGTTSVPKYLLTNYIDLDINNLEILLIIHILSELDYNPSPSLELLAQRMKISTSEIESMIGRLVERKLLAIEQHWNHIEQRWYSCFSFVGLIEELAERWAISRMKQYEEEISQKDTRRRLNNETTTDLKLQHLVDIFEQELGRPLTGLECEHITNWLSSHFSEELIVEALRRGVSAGIRNFRYLDSILREWEKKSLRTKIEVENDDANFQSRNMKKTKTRPNRKTPPEKYENFYL